MFSACGGRITQIVLEIAIHQPQYTPKNGAEPRVLDQATSGCEKKSVLQRIEAGVARDV